MKALLLVSLPSIAALWAACGAPGPAPPQSARQDFREVLHGVELEDPYHWLEDHRGPEAAKWIERQNEYSSAILGKVAGRERLANRLAELMDRDTMGAPVERGGRFFFARKNKDQALPVLYVRQGAEGQDKVLLDPRPLSDDHSTQTNLMAIAPDGSLIAYAVRRGGQDEVEIKFRRVDTAEDLADQLPKGLYSDVAITPNDQEVYYARRSRSEGSRLFHHAFGAAPESDAVIFGEGRGAGQFIGVSLSEDGHYLLATVQHGWARSEIHLKDIARNGTVKPVVADIDGLFNPHWAGPETLVVETGWGAPRRRVFRVDLRNPEMSKWREIVPESNEDSIDDVAVAGGMVFVTYLHNVQSRIAKFSLDGEKLGEIPLPGSGSASIIGRWNSPAAALSFTSFTVPPSVSLYDTGTGNLSPWFEPDTDLDAAQFETKQVWYRSKDGASIPMFLIHKKALVPDGNRPVLLYGYGGFNVSLTPRFTTTAVLWAEAGGVYALANIRGGGEFGEEWHRAGMLDRKQNVFDDFIAAAEWLIANKYTNAGRLAIQGASNGGLLVGAALSQRPDLFRAVVCAYPDLDMVRYYRYTENNNPPALLEYGNGADPGQFEFLRAYSPYERVQKGVAYPAVLFTTGDGDTRVPPQQALKMTAKLQWATSSGRPILLRYDQHSGHAGGKTLADRIRDQASEQAFLMDQVGVK